MLELNTIQKSQSFIIDVRISIQKSNNSFTVCFLFTRVIMCPFSLPNKNVQIYSFPHPLNIKHLAENLRNPRSYRHLAASPIKRPIPSGISTAIGHGPDPLYIEENMPSDNDTMTKGPWLVISPTTIANSLLAHTSHTHV